MKLNRVTIKNFRSIDYASVYFNVDRARVLVGINESGKSNVLKAMSLLSKDISVDPMDKRVECRGEELIDIAYVYFEFHLDDLEFDTVYKKISKKFVTTELDTPLLKLKDGTQLTLRDYCRLRCNAALYWADIMAGKKYPTTWSFSKNYSIINNWKKLKDKNSIANFINSKGTLVIVGEEIFFDSSKYDNSSSVLVNFDVEDIDSLIRAEIFSVISKNLPECIYWKYDESNILPTQVDMDSFQADPDNCLPLKSCFELAGYADAAATLVNARGKTRHQLNNLLDDIADKTTKYIRSVWKDYRNVSIEFSPDGTLIVPIVKDKNINFDFVQRSDGFKRFVSFLLLISSKVSTSKIKNTLILIDEPEIGLHPTGARNLMEELIKISESNYVAYTTHSIFMIDKENIGRHLIVEKNDEITQISVAENSSITDEEVLYKAIGFTLLEILKPVNFLFEGWRDKKLFAVSQKAYVKKHKANKKLLELEKNISICHASGVKDVKNIAPLIELAGRTLKIVSDSDNAAKEAQRKHLSDKMHGEWKTYQDITGNPAHITGEDFVQPQVVLKKVIALRERYEQLPVLTVENLSSHRGRLYGIDNWLNSLGNPDLKNQLLNEIKSLIFNDLKANEIIDEYQLVLDHLYS